MDMEVEFVEDQGHGHGHGGQGHGHDDLDVGAAAGRQVLANEAEANPAHDNDGGDIEIDERLTFLRMADLPTIHVLSYLDVQSLQTLRLVSHLTKSWVEKRPLVLRRLVIRVPDTERLTSVLDSDSDSDVPWNSLFLGNKNSMNRPAAFLSGTAQLVLRSAPYLRALRIYALSFSAMDVVQKYLANLGPALETFHLDGEVLLGEVSQFGDYLGVMRGLDVLPNLKELSFTPYHHHYADFLRPFLEQLLRMCPNLTKISLPTLTYIRGRGSREFPPDIPNPFIAYVKTLVQKKNASSNSSENLVIDLFSNLDGLVDLSMTKNYPHYNLRSVFPLDYKTLIELAVLCEQINGRLVNVPITALPTREQVTSSSSSVRLPREQIKCLQNRSGTIQSVVCADNRVQAFDNFFVPPTASVTLVLDLELHADLTHFDLPRHANVTRVALSCPQTHQEWLAVRGARELIPRLFQLLSVETLEIFRGFQLVQSLEAQLSSSPWFPSLDKLGLTGFGSRSDGGAGGGLLKQLLKTLPKTLKVLNLRACELSEDYFFASPAPAAQDVAAAGGGVGAVALAAAPPSARPLHILHQLTRLEDVSITDCRTYRTYPAPLHGAGPGPGPDSQHWVQELKSVFEAMTNLKTFAFDIRHESS